VSKFRPEVVRLSTASRSALGNADIHIQ